MDMLLGEMEPGCSKDMMKISNSRLLERESVHILCFPFLQRKPDKAQ